MVLTALRVTFGKTGVRITDCMTCVFVCIEEPVFVFECPPNVRLRWELYKDPGGVDILSMHTYDHPW